MAGKPKLSGRYDLKAADRRRNLIIQLGLTAIVVIIGVALVGYIVISHNNKKSSSEAKPVRVVSSKLVTKQGTSAPTAVMSFYEDFLCPACGNFERSFGPTISKLIDTGAIAADYYFVSILDSPRNNDYSSRAGAAAYCVADESIDAFRRFHAALFSKALQPSETGSNFPDDARLIEVARQSGAAGTVPGCIDGGKYISRVKGMASAANINATPTIRINGERYAPSTPAALIDKIREIVGDVPGLDAAAASAAS